MLDKVLTSCPIVMGSPPGADPELELVDRLVRAAGQAGVTADPTTIVNIYVACKTKPLAILAGPPSTGKMAIVEALGRVLLPEPWRLQMMLGHAWWAEGSSSVAAFTEAQTRSNTAKIYALLQEAAQPENAGRVYMGCLTQISSAELVGFFSEVALQWQHERLMCLPSFHLREPISISDNVLLFGTMDSELWGWADEDLYSGATVIQWPAFGVRLPVDRLSPAAPMPGAETAFLASRVRSEREALQKLQAVPGYRPQLMHLFCQVEEVFRTRDLPLPECIVEDVLVYVANSWTEQGRGLFDPDTACNMTIALDLALSQLTLTPASGRVQASAALQNGLGDIVDSHFPRSSSFLRALTTAPIGKEVSRPWNEIQCAV